MQKKKPIQVIFHQEGTEETKQHFLEETIADWYAGLLRRTLEESDYTTEEKCEMLDRLIQEMEKEPLPAPDSSNW